MNGPISTTNWLTQSDACSTTATSCLFLLALETTKITIILLFESATNQSIYNVDRSYMTHIIWLIDIL